MPDDLGFSMSGGGNVQAGTIYIGVRVQDVDKAVAQMKGLETQSKQTAQTGQKSMQSLGGSFKELQQNIMAAATAFYSFKFAYDAFLGYGKQETALNRIDMAIRRQGDSAFGVRQEIDALGTRFIELGQREESAWSGFQRLYQATGDTRRSMELLNLALGFAAAQGADAGTVAENLARAYAGNDRQLKMLLSQYGFASKSLKEFADLEALVKTGAGEATTVLSEQETAVNQLKAAWDGLKDTLGKILTPALTTELSYFGKLIKEPWRVIGPGSAMALVEAWNEGKYARDAAAREREAQEGADYWSNILRGNYLQLSMKPKKPGSAEVEDDTYRYMREQLFDSQQGRGWGNVGWGTPEAEQENGEQLRKIYDAQMKDRVQKWDDAHREMFRISDTFTSTVGGLMERMLNGSQVTFNDIASAFRSMIARMLTDLAMSRLQTWLSGMITGGSFGGGARPGSGTEFNWSNGAGFGGARPVGGGGWTQEFKSSPSGDIIESIYNGASLHSRRKVGRGLILDGSRQILRTT